MPKISVIIPVYNVEDYIDECLKSVVTQTLDNFEVLVINDGSLDQSQKIIDKYVTEYSFVHSFQKKNGGLSSARNYGIKKAKSDYVYFLDGDDFIAPDLLQKCYEVLKRENSDIVYFDFYEYYNAEKTRVMKGIKNPSVAGKERYMISPPAAWNKVFRTSLFLDHDITFPEGLWYEDLATIPRLLYFASKVDYIEIPLYYYRQREGSIMNTVNPKMFQMYDVLEILRNFFVSHDSFEEYYSVLTILSLLNLDFVNLTLATSDMENRLHHQMRAISYMKEHYPDWNHNIFYHQLKWYTKWHIQILFHEKSLKIYNRLRSRK